MTAATRSEQSRRDLTKSSPMGYAVAQLAKAASLIFAVSVITFFLAKAAGFDPVDAYFGSELTASPEQRAALASKWGVDQPTVVQFGLWWWNLLHGDLGTSLVFERPVSAVIGDALANSSMLLFIAPGCWGPASGWSRERTGGVSSTGSSAPSATCSQPSPPSGSG